MKDSILAGTGNSRYLKTSLSADITWQRALELLRAGTFPVDFNGTNPNGYTQVGTPLNKANLMTDATAAKMDLTSSATPNDFLGVVADRVNSVIHYTTGEVETGGTWIDGKPIYRALFTGSGSKTAGTNKLETVGNLAFTPDTIVSMRGIAVPSNNCTRPIPYAAQGTNAASIALYIAYDTSPRTVVLDIGSSYTQTTYWTVIIEYTRAST